LEPKSRHEKKGGQLVPKMVKKYKNINSVEVHPQLSHHRHSVDDCALLLVSAGSPPNLFHPKIFIQPIG
jgi:hypothetical protein